jgi:uncharacterized protein YdeI (YjbR/CyaY-like superfamily)
MGKKDPRVDDYIQNSAEFARPILKHLRAAVHGACPEVAETIKWGMPFFDYKGTMCHMAAFKGHCAFGFWKGSLILDESSRAAENEAMGHFGRLTRLSDLPDDKRLAAYIREAARLNDEGIKVARRKPAQKKEIPVPEDLRSALRKSKKALATFEAFRPSHRREYVQWITEAKRDQTRQTRIQTAVKWMADGKARNWKHR